MLNRINYTVDHGKHVTLAPAKATDVKRPALVDKLENKPQPATPQAVAAPALTLSRACVGHMFNCGRGDYYERMSYIRLDTLFLPDWIAVDLERLSRAMHVSPQNEMGVNAIWGCGPNSLARIAEIFGRPFENYQWVIDQCPRTFGLPFGIPEPHWARVGPDPDSFAKFINDRLGEFQGHNFAISTREDNWGRMVEHFRWHLERGRPMIVMTSRDWTTQHYSCLVGINFERDEVALLNTDGHLRKCSIPDLSYKMDAGNVAGNVFGYLSCYNAIRFDPRPIVLENVNMSLLPRMMFRPAYRQQRNR